jgi:hypothetical protein
LHLPILSWTNWSSSISSLRTCNSAFMSAKWIIFGPKGTSTRRHCAGSRASVLAR